MFKTCKTFILFSIQDGVLEQVGKILHRMDELATVLDITATDGDRENYNKEFIELADQLSKFSSEKFGDINLFGGGTAGNRLYQRYRSQ